MRAPLLSLRRTTAAVVAVAGCMLTPTAVAVAQTAGAPAVPGARAAPPANASPAPAARPADVRSADAITAALYDVISGPAGQKRDWNRFHSLFLPGARLIVARGRPDSAGRAQPVVLTPETYIQRAGASLEERGFFEREIAQRSESFGRVTHRFSTYDSRRTAADAKPFARGINSIQLLDDGQRWWVVTILWDSEGPDNPIPARYLPR